MTRRARILIIFALVAGAVGACATISRRHDERLRRDGFAKAQKLKADIDRYFPTGTPRRQFTDWSDRWPGWHTVNEGKEQLMSVGQIPSDVWYCGPWEVGVSVLFEQDRISATRVERWGVNCL